MGIEELVLREREKRGFERGLAEREQIETELRARIAELERILSEKNNQKS